ncbi:MAG: METTL5 family protein [Candidatus Thermoplasmatota archaeon]
MKKKELEMLLQDVPVVPNPIPELEQYMTPAGIAADILFLAYQFGDIEDKVVLDLGCGTGIFAIGSYLMGAKKVIGVDIDKQSVELAERYTKKHGYNIDFIVQDVDDFDMCVDTTIMNPPFGAQKSNIRADRKFIVKACSISSVVYSLHLSKTVPFLYKLIKAIDHRVTYQKSYSLPIKHTFRFHMKDKVEYDVTLLRIERT